MSEGEKKPTVERWRYWWGEAEGPSEWVDIQIEELYGKGCPRPMWWINRPDKQRFLAQVSARVATSLFVKQVDDLAGSNVRDVARSARSPGRLVVRAPNGFRWAFTMESLESIAFDKEVL